MKAATLRRLAIAVALAAPVNAMTPQEQANLAFVFDWLREIFQGRHLELAAKYQAESYIQHDINVQTGRDGFVKLFSGFGPPVNPIPATLASPPAIHFAKGDYVALIWEHEAQDPTDASKTYKYNSYDLLRLENGKIQEHWDLLRLENGKIQEHWDAAKKKPPAGRGN